MQEKCLQWYGHVLWVALLLPAPPTILTSMANAFVEDQSKNGRTQLKGTWKIILLDLVAGIHWSKKRDGFYQVCAISFVTVSTLQISPAFANQGVSYSSIFCNYYQFYFWRLIFILYHGAATPMVICAIKHSYFWWGVAAFCLLHFNLPTQGWLLLLCIASQLHILDGCPLASSTGCWPQNQNRNPITCWQPSSASVSWVIFEHGSGTVNLWPVIVQQTCDRHRQRVARFVGKSPPISLSFLWPDAAF